MARVQQFTHRRGESRAKITIALGCKRKSFGSSVRNSRSLPAGVHRIYGDIVCTDQLANGRSEIADETGRKWRRSLRVAAGESRVFASPGMGVLQKMPIATPCTLLPSRTWPTTRVQSLTGSAVPSPRKARGSITPATQLCAGDGSPQKLVKAPISLGYRVDGLKIFQSLNRVGQDADNSDASHISKTSANGKS